MVEALLEEAQQDITPEVGSEVILVDEAGETPGIPRSSSCITWTTFSFAVPDAMPAEYLGSLRSYVFETRTVTESELFSLLTCPHTTTFTLLNIFSLLEMSSIKI